MFHIANPDAVKPIRTYHVSHPLLDEARAIGFWHASFTTLEKLVVSHQHRALSELPNGALAARVIAERECASRLARHFELNAGAL